MKKVLLVLFMVVTLAFAGGAGVAAAEDNTTTDEPTTEETTNDELTEEEWEEILNDSEVLALALWDKILAILGVSSLGGVIGLFLAANKKFKFFGNESKQVNESVKKLEKTASHLTKKERNIEKALLSLVVIANVDPVVKKQIQELIDDGEDLTTADYTKALNKIAETKEEEKSTEEVKSLLDDME